MAVLKEANFSGTNGSHFKLQLEYTYTQDQAENKTTIVYTLNFISMDGYSGSGTSNSVNGYINGDNVGSTSSIGVNQTKELGTKTVVVNHNVDGTFPSTSYSASINTQWTLGSASVNGTLTGIPNIDRYPIITEAPDFTDIDNPKVKYTTALGFTGATVEIAINAGGEDVVDYREVVVANGEYTFNLTDTERNALRNKTPNSNTLSVTYSLRTTHGQNTYYSFATKTMTIVNANPTFNIAYQDTNATTTAITQNNQQIIQNHSTPQLNLTNATALKGASLYLVEVELNGVTTQYAISTATRNINLGTLNIANDINANVTLIDSRGNRTLAVVPLTILAWQQPSAIITLNRKSNYYTQTDIKVDANYSSLDSKNVISIKFRQKKTTEQNYGAYTTLTDNVTTTFNADNLYEWDIQVLVEDLIASTTYNLTLGIGQPILFIDRRKRNVGIDCFAKDTNALEVNGNAEISGSLIVNNADIYSYSTTEQVIGTYNTKPLYRKVIDFGSLPNATSKQVAHNISNLGTIVTCKAFAYDGSTKMPLPYIYPDVNMVSYWITVDTIDDTNVGIVTGTDRTSYTGYFILEYTKTSD